MGLYLKHHEQGGKLEQRGGDKKIHKEENEIEKGGGGKAKLEIIKEHDEKKDHEHHLK